MSNNMQVNDNKPPARIGLEIAVLGSARLTENDDWWTQAHQLGVLLGDCWLPIIKSIREHLVVGDVDINLLRFASSPGEAVREIQAGLQDKKRIGPGPRG